MGSSSSETKKRGRSPVVTRSKRARGSSDALRSKAAAAPPSLLTITEAKEDDVASVYTDAEVVRADPRPNAVKSSSLTMPTLLYSITPDQFASLTGKNDMDPPPETLALVKSITAGTQHVRHADKSYSNATLNRFKGTAETNRKLLSDQARAFLRGADAVDPAAAPFYKLGLMRFDPAVVEKQWMQVMDQLQKAGNKVFVKAINMLRKADKDGAPRWSAESCVRFLALPVTKSKSQIKDDRLGEALSQLKARLPRILEKEKERLESPASVVVKPNKKLSVRLAEPVKQRTLSDAVLEELKSIVGGLSTVDTSTAVIAGSEKEALAAFSKTQRKAVEKAVADGAEHIPVVPEELSMFAVRCSFGVAAHKALLERRREHVTQGRRMIENARDEVFRWMLARGVQVQYVPMKIGDDEHIVTLRVQGHVGSMLPTRPALRARWVWDTLGKMLADKPQFGTVITSTTDVSTLAEASDHLDAIVDEFARERSDVLTTFESDRQELIDSIFGEVAVETGPTDDAKTAHTTTSRKSKTASKFIGKGIRPRRNVTVNLTISVRKMGAK